MVLCPMTNPQEILDCGTGSCAWASDAARAYSPCAVTGIDFSDIIIPRSRPDTYVDGRRLRPEYEAPFSVGFDFADLNEPFPDSWNDTYDVVNSQLLASGIHKDRWDSYISDIYRVLKPGGWAQFFEIYPNVQSYNGSFTSENAIRQWSEKYLKVMEKIRNPRIGMQLQGKMMQAGFTSMIDRSLQIPLCGWSTDKEKALGELNKDNAQEFLYSAALWQFTTGEDAMTLEDFKKLVKMAQKEAATEAFKPYFMLYVHIGQKPIA